MSTGIAIRAVAGAIVWRAAPAHDLRRAIGIFEVARRVYQINGSDRRGRKTSNCRLCAWIWSGRATQQCSPKE
jgi:hypothetical protein